MESDLEVYYQPAGQVDSQAELQCALDLDIHNSDHTETRGSGGSNPFPQDTEQPIADVERTCWICFANREDNRRAKWVHPCQCRGATKWAHQSCLYRWIDEKQQGNHRRALVCQQCQTEYIIVFPRINPLAGILEKLDFAVRRTCPYLALGMFMCWVYWTAITYGAITVIQVVGQERAAQLVENEIFLLVGMPFIPVGLLLMRLVRWEDAVLKAMRSRYNILRKLPFFHWAGEPEAGTGDLGVLSDSFSSLPPIQHNPSITEPIFISRLLCGAFFLPSIAAAVGNVFFRSIEDPMHRTIIGGIAYIGIKGILKIYLKQKLYVRRRGRRIVNYTDENVRLYFGGQNREAPAHGSQNPQANADNNPNQRSEIARQFAGFAGLDENMEDSSSVATTDSEDCDPDS
ncbi:E3 ubiquitin-protein ligase MARCHF5 [Drosophila santomea]|uniref:E3 ubiquitin-protein ligase MARCHF5 n=1 Tax=Drosophila santomea TaxID=129105 RepID=UPI0019536915|nr:E3 ubiquitin-protein ligase MARCHF5 [Drosophila santomea]